MIKHRVHITFEGEVKSNVSPKELKERLAQGLVLGTSMGLTRDFNITLKPKPSVRLHRVKNKRLRIRAVSAHEIFAQKRLDLRASSYLTEADEIEASETDYYYRE